MPELLRRWILLCVFCHMNCFCFSDLSAERRQTKAQSPASAIPASRSPPAQYHAGRFTTFPEKLFRLPFPLPRYRRNGCFYGGWCQTSFVIPHAIARTAATIATAENMNIMSQLERSFPQNRVLYSYLGECAYWNASRKVF